MKHSLFAIIGCLLLVGCSSSSVTYRLTLKPTDATMQAQLVEESIRVIERRLDAMEEGLKNKEVSQENGEYTLTISVADSDVANALSAGLTAPFTFNVMTEAPAETADVTVEGHGSFAKTNVTEADLEWVQSRQQPGSTKGEVRLVFTKDGSVKMGEVFKASKGKTIGLFVRNQLISKLLVESDELKEDIVIRDIPDAEMAQVFAEDVNVGINVTFTPAQ